MNGVFVWNTNKGQVTQEVKLVVRRQPDIFFFCDPKDITETMTLIPKNIVSAPPLPHPKQPGYQPKRVDKESPLKLIEEIDKEMEEFWKNS